jgi:hypothetical protein
MEISLLIAALRFEKFKLFLFDLLSFAQQQFVLVTIPQLESFDLCRLLVDNHLASEKFTLAEMMSLDRLLNLVHSRSFSLQSFEECVLARFKRF